MNWRTDRGGCRILEIGDVTHIIKRRPGLLDWELTSYSGGWGVEPKMIDHNWFKTLRDAKNYAEKKVKKGENNVISQ